MRIAGVDGYRGGWVVAWEPNQTASPPATTQVELFPTFAEIVEQEPKAVVVDIPIGLLDKGVREADRLARTHLARRACCVFNPPLRGMLACKDYKSASAYGERVEGKRISKQTWAIMPKIIEVDAIITPKRQAFIREAHPEVSFSCMNNGKPITSDKHSLAGQQARLSLLEPHFGEIRGELEKHRGIQEDIIDAFAMLWTARRIESGVARAFPASTLRDSRGLLMQIWA